MTSLVHVLFVRLKWPPETFIIQLVKGLAHRGIQVTLAVQDVPKNAQLFPANVDFLWTPPWGDSGVKSALHSARWLVSAAGRSTSATGQLVRSARANGTIRTSTAYLHQYLPFVGRQWDVIYFPWNTMAIAYMAYFKNRPVVISCRGSQINVATHNPERSDLRAGLETTFREAAAIHCVSQHVLENATQYGLDPAKAVVIRPAVDPDFFFPAQDRESSGAHRLRMITTGSLIWRKGFEYLLLALKETLTLGIPAHLTIIGDGPERQRLLYTIQDLGLQECVELCGHLPPEEVRQRLQAADVFVLASLSEGISNAVLEAMACGLPVITTDAGGMTEAITNDVEGLVVPPRDVEAMVNALRCLWEQPERARAMGIAGRRRVMGDFCAADQADAFAELLRRVA